MKILRLSKVQSVTGLSRSSIYEFVGNGAFPKPIKLGVRSVGWLEEEVNNWIESRINASRGGAK